MALHSNILSVQWIDAQYWQFLVKQPKCTSWASSSLFIWYQAERVSVLIKCFGCEYTGSPEMVGVVPSLHCGFVGPLVDIFRSLIHMQLKQIAPFVETIKLLKRSFMIKM
ncbi:hypothetical protein ILYODFUR_013944 [Ilyodon furcidens]|uniref:Uncharacterized protein n=1 Tax=Ilyodon furcidens TaxID=33524 RepID=A0ABV0TJW2_9TELE